MEAQESIAIATWVYAALTCGILIVLYSAGRVAKRQLRLMRRDSMRSFVKNLMEQWMTDALVDARDTLERMLNQEARKFPDMERAELLKQKLNELQKTRSHLARHILRIPHYFEMVYTLVVGDPDALDEVLRLFRGSIIYWFELYYPYIKEQRDTWELPDIYIEFEKLYRQAQTARKK